MLTDVRVLEGGARAELALSGPNGESATVWLGDEAGRPRGGYRLGEGVEATDALVEGLRALLGVFRGPREGAVDAQP